MVVNRIHQRRTIASHDEWYTPPEIFAALKVQFDLDPASPGQHHWVPAKKVYTIADDGLSKPWFGLVWLNPPFGGRNGVVPWLRRFVDHRDGGICLVSALTSAGWFHDWTPRCDAILFPRGKTKFIRADGTIGKSPNGGIALLGRGSVATNAMCASELGICLRW